MKIALLSDLHIPARSPKARKDNAVNTAFDKLEFVYDYCCQNDIKTILQAGDWCDAPRSWSLLPTMSEFMSIYKNKINTYSVFGQHDTYLYSEVRRSHTNMGILSKAGLLNILPPEPLLISGIPVKNKKRVYVHGVNWGDDIEDCKRSKDEYHILVAHAPVSDRPAYPGHEFTKAKKLLEQLDYDCILVGDVHIPFMHCQQAGPKRNKWIVNTGPMMRLAANADMMEHKPHFAVIDTENLESMVFVPIEVALPSEEVLSREHLTQAKRIKDVANDFINTLQKTGSKITVGARKKLESYLNANDIDEDIQKIIMVVIEEEGEDE